MKYAFMIFCLVAMLAAVFVGYMLGASEAMYQCDSLGVFQFFDVSFSCSGEGVKILRETE